jgi:hypothetical protein
MSTNRGLSLMRTEYVKVRPDPIKPLLTPSAVAIGSAEAALRWHKQE